MERVELPQGPQEKVLEIFFLLKTKNVMLTDQVCGGVAGGAGGGVRQAASRAVALRPRCLESAREIAARQTRTVRL